MACAGLVAAGQAPTAVAASNVHPKVVLSASTGPPTSTVGVSGTGFAAHETVNISFGTTGETPARTNGRGAFHGPLVSVPASARPGTHWITAIGRRSGRSARAKFLVNTNWAQFHYCGRREGTNPYENVLSAASVRKMGLDWSYTTGGPVESSPVVANGVVYIGSGDGNVYALNARTGAKRWSYPTGVSVASSPAVANGVVYIASGDGNVYALNARTGAKLWSYPTGNFVDSSPAVANGVVYVGSTDGNVYAFRPSGASAPMR
jgi:outer membrane protein assembly factor BamB